MKNEVSWAKVSHLFLRSFTLSWALFAIMILVAGHQASAQQAPAPAAQQMAPQQACDDQRLPPAQRENMETESDKPSFTIQGEVRSAGRFDLVKNFRVKDAIMTSGGLTKGADLNRAEIIRFNKRQEDYYTIYFKVANALSGDPSDNFILLDKDRIVIHAIREQADQKNVSIDGEIVKTGSYPYIVGMTVRDLVLKGGGTLKTSYMDEAEISSVISEGGKLYSTGRKFINLKKAMEGDPANNVPLYPNDRLFVKRIPDEGALLESVSASGEFRLPGKYAITKGERLSSLIERAGGYGPNAYPRAAVFTRERVRRLQQNSLEEMAAWMERELLAQNLATAAKSISAEEARNKKAETEVQMKLLHYIKTLKATGRITIAITDEQLLKGSPHDIELEDGDNLYIPRKPSAVSVVGAVVSEGSYIYNDKWHYRDYIATAGGSTPYADDADVFIIKVDGSTQKPASGSFQWNNERKRWESGAYGQKIKPIEPGDIIVVPERIAQIAWLREIRDITRIMMNTGVVMLTGPP